MISKTDQKRPASGERSDSKAAEDIVDLNVASDTNRTSESELLAAIRKDARHDSVKYLLRSNTGIDGE